MSPLYPAKSNSFTTEDWVKASEGLKVSAYNPAFSDTPQAGPSEGIFTQVEFESTLRKASRRVLTSVPAAKKK
jgi:hypothetical protein